MKRNWNTANSKSYYKNQDKIRKFRSEMTEAEKLLWKELRNKKLGIKFRRQHMIDRYIPDFVALKIKLIIEVDGKIHKFRSQHDRGRAAELGRLGYTVIRFSNEEVLNDTGKVIEEIKHNIENMRM